jgi:hypothetical protein
VSQARDGLERTGQPLVLRELVAPGGTVVGAGIHLTADTIR